MTMRGEREVIDNATIVVTDNRITAIGPASDVDVPAEARVIDVTGHPMLLQRG